MVPIPLFPYALLVCLIVNLLLTKTLSDSRFYVSSYYSGCSHEQTRDRLAGDARVDDPETSRRLPCIMYIYSPCVVVGHYFGH